MNVVVIRELDPNDYGSVVIGVASSVPKAELLITDYYGSYAELSRHIINECNLIYTVVIFVDDEELVVSLEWFELDRV
jgi:hypothetical protein